MNYINLEQLLALHVLVIQRFGGATGVRDIGRLEAVLATQTQAVFGIELYVTVYDKAAAILRGVIADHPFSDGNKRTGTLTALTFLEINGYTITAKKGEIEDFAVSVATDHLTVETIAQWLKDHSQPTT